MKKSKESKRTEYVVMFAALGFMIGSAIWFWIYFSKSDLYFDKLIIYMIAGMIVGGMIGEGINYFKSKRKK